MSDGGLRELRELVSKLSDGALGAEGARRLNELLKEDPVAQEAYLDQLMVDALLEREFVGSIAGAAQPAMAGALGGPSAGGDATDREAGAEGPGWPWSAIMQSFRCRPSARVLVPLLLLIAALGSIWILSAPRQGVMKAEPFALSDAGFEPEAPSSGAGAAARWYGEGAESVERCFGVTPIEGRRMLRFVSPSAEPGNTCEVHRLVDLRTLGGIAGPETVVEASAFFNSLKEDFDENDYIFKITVFAFSEDPSGGFGEWPPRWRQPLTFSGCQLAADTAPQSWQRVDARLPLPTGTQFLVIRLSVIRTEPGDDDQFPGQFVDKLALEFVCSR
jgi:hypothetical protein